MEWYEILWRVALVFAAIGAAIGILLFIRKLQVLFETRKLMTEQRKRPTLPYDLLKTSFPHIHMYHGTVLPSFQKNQPATVRAPILVINRGGITVIRVLRYNGEIDNPYHGDWVRYRGEEQIVFQNPFELNETVTNSIRRILRKKRISNIPINSYVVYTMPGVRFHHDTENLIDVRELVNEIKYLSENRFLSRKEIKLCCETISEYAKPMQVPTDQTTLTELPLTTTQTDLHTNR